MDLRDHLQTTVRRVRRRLALRRAIVGASAGLTTAAFLSVPVVLGLSRVLPADRAVLAGLVATGVLLMGGLIGGTAVQLARRGLQRNEVAQLLDHQLGTDEAWVTAAWLLDDATAPRRDDLLTTLSAQLDRPAMHQLLALRWPRHLRLVPVAALLWMAVFLLPSPDLHAASTSPSEAERLAERLDEVAAQTDDAPLPEHLEDDLDALTEELADLDPSASVERIADLQDQLDAFTDELAPSEELLDELEKAADALADQPELAEALQDADLKEAANQLEQLADAAAGLPPDEKSALAEQMAAAGEQLAQSPDAALSQAGEALQQAGEQLGQQASADREGRSGEQQSETDAKMERLQDQIRQAQQRGEQLQQDRKALQRAQQTNGALDAARQRMEDAASRNTEGANGEGESGEAGEAGESGTGEQGSGRDGARGGEGSGNDGTRGQAAASASNAHTWEDEGEVADRQDGFNDQDRTSDRTAAADQHIDDFERLYAPDRLRHIDALMAGASAAVDERGEIELVPMRRTGSEETAERALVALPDDYASAATDAINDETVPPGYRDAIKQYFDQME